MKLKMVAAIMFILLATAAFAWPSLPKAIAVGQGTYKNNGAQTPFLWGVMQSLSKNENIYILISISITESDISKLDLKLEVILRDEGSTLLRVKMNVSKKQPRDITKTASEKISSACPGIHFDLDSALY